MYKILITIGYYLSLDKVFDHISSIILKIRLKRIYDAGISLNFVPQGGHTFHIYGDLSKFQIDPTSHIKSDTFIECSGGVTIGKHLHVGQSLKIFSSNHDYRSKEMIPYGKEDLIGPVRIGDFVWIGANVSILPGVTIGDGSIIGMSSVVTRDVEPGAVVAGNPARVIGKRDMKVFNSLKEKGRFI